MPLYWASHGIRGRGSSRTGGCSLAGVYVMLNVSTGNFSYAASPGKRRRVPGGSSCGKSRVRWPRRQSGRSCNVHHAP
eukprot:1222407-Rhodomonas_salina.2